MDNLDIGDLVVLTAGSMRMAVEAVEGEQVSCVWCHEGKVGRDAFNAKLLKKWEHREEDRSARPESGPRPHRAESGPKPYRSDRDGGGKPYGAGREAAKPHGAARDDKPRGKPGWDGKPREKKFFRKDG